MAKLLNSNNKIKRLRWQIEDLEEEMKYCNENSKGVLQKAINTRKKAIEYLEKNKSMQWEKLNKMFHISYFNVKGTSGMIADTR